MLPVPAWQQAARVLGAVIALMALLHFAGLATGSSLLRLESEGNVPTWMSSVLFLFAAAACALAAASYDSVGRRGWVLLGLVMCAFSLDEVARLHERVETRGGVHFVLMAIEPIMAAGFVVIVWLALRTLPRAALWMLGAAAIAIAGAQLASMLSEELAPTGVLRQLLIMAEELLEVVTGSLVMCTGLRAFEVAQPVGVRAEQPLEELVLEKRVPVLPTLQR